MQDKINSLVLLLARLRPSEDVIEEALEIAGSGIDLKGFHALSLRQGVAPLIFKNLGFLNAVPDEMHLLFRNSYLQSLGSSLKYAGELKMILNVLGENNIDAVPLKGAVLSNEIFGDPALYPVADLDIMVHLKDIETISRIMESMGYSTPYETDPYLLERSHVLTFARAGRKPVEFHFRLAKKRYFNIPEDFWWQDLREMNFNGRTCRVLSHEKTILFLSLHFFAHGFSNLKFLVSIAEMLRSYGHDMKWQAVREYAEILHIEKPLMITLKLSEDLLNAPLHPDFKILFEQSPLPVKWLYKKVRKNIFNEQTSLSYITLLFTISQYSASEIIIRLAKWLFPPSKEVAYRYKLPLKSKRLYLYYLLNPFLLFFKKRGV